MNENNQITLKTENDAFQKGFYCSIKAETKEDKKRIYNALESCDKLLNESVGEVIDLKDVYVESFVHHDDKTNTDQVKYRTILFGADGTSYATTAYGVYNALRKIFSIYGDAATWSEPLKVQVIKRPIGNGKETLTLVIA